MLILFCLWSLLVFLVIALPIFEHQRRVHRAELLGRYRHFQKDLLRLRYPKLREYTYRELERYFDIDELYAEI